MLFCYQLLVYNNEMKLTCKSIAKSRQSQSQLTGDIVDVTQFKPRQSLLSFLNILNPCKWEQQTTSINEQSYKEQKIQQFNKSQKNQLNAKQRLFTLPSFSPSSCQSYLLSPSLQQLIHSQCYHRLRHINKDYEQNMQFILEALENYAYQLSYTVQIGSIISHVSQAYEKREARSVINHIVRKFPEVMATKMLEMNGEIRQRKAFLLNYALHCLAFYIAPVYPQFKSFRFSQQQSNTSRWVALTKRLFQSLLLQFIPPQLSQCIFRLYLAPLSFNKKDLYKEIHPYLPFIRLIVSLFHYVCFMKKHSDVNEFYNICSSCYMGLVEWPIVIANSAQFDLPIPKIADIGVKVQRKER